MFENHRKSIIKHCERSELRLHFEWTKIQYAKNCPIWQIFRKHEVCGQTALPDMSLLKGQKWWKMPKFKNATFSVIFKQCVETYYENFVKIEIFFDQLRRKRDFRPLCQTNNYFVGVFYILWINLASFSVLPGLSNGLAKSLLTSFLPDLPPEQYYFLCIYLHHCGVGF